MNQAGMRWEMAALHLRTQRAIVSFTVLGLLFVAVGMAVLGTGCGNKGDASASTVPAPAPTTTQAQQVPVSQAERELAFVEMVPKYKAVSNGQVVYYYFSYADRDGVVHACELPKAMAEGKWTESAWHCTFQAYEVHKDEPFSQPVVVAQTDSLEDFPFVSPPESVATPIDSINNTLDAEMIEDVFMCKRGTPEFKERMELLQTDFEFRKTVANTYYQKYHKDEGCPWCDGTGKSDNKNALGQFEECNYCKGTGKTK